ncbi:palmitoyl-(protein) hydrolase [Aureococcus anophagefferens]|uniref:Palmitoyl-(Protein) hydrolase n=1 Tax=Aureococcus anophagefferens TaxID=44056 RepID=A0ABR1G9Y7_AURAN
MGAASIIFYLAASGDTTHMEKLTRGSGGGRASSLLKKRKIQRRRRRARRAAAHAERPARRRRRRRGAAAGVAGTADAEQGAAPGRRARGGRSVDVEPLDAVVLDSPYSDIHQLAVDLASTRLIGGFSTPWVVTQAVLHFLETTILETAKFNISDLKPIDHVGDCATPALFLHAEDDSLVGISHMEALVRSYGGPRAGQQKRAKFPTSKAPISAVFHSSVPWVRQDHRLVKVNGLAYSRGARVSSAPPAPEAPPPARRLESDHHADAPAPN